MAWRQETRNVSGPRGKGSKNNTELQATTDDVGGQGLVAVSGVLGTGLVVFYLWRAKDGI